MKYRLALAVAIAAAVSPSIGSAQTYVDGYTRSDGTYVAGHYRSAPNSTKLDNYSTQGNVNPYNGRAGTVDPYQPTTSNPYGSPYNQPRSRPNTYQQLYQPAAPARAPTPYGGTQRRSSWGN